MWGENLHHGLWLRGDETVEEATDNLTSLVARRAGVNEGTRVCDVGCGYGGPARMFANQYGAQVVGVTLSSAQHTHALRRAGDDPRIQFFVRDWLRNGFPDRSFDAVVAIESASHMPDTVAFIEECRRVSRVGGRVVIAAWLASERASDWQVRRLLRPICTEGRLAALPTASEYQRWFQSSGLRELRFEDLTTGVHRTWSVCIRRACVRLARDGTARRFLLNPDASERVFAPAILRIWLAYRMGALRYGVFTMVRA